MKKVLVIGSRHDQAGEEQNLNNYQKYFQELLGSGYAVHNALLDDLIFDISPSKFSIYVTKNDSEVSKYQLVIMRGVLKQDYDAIFAISKYCQQNGVHYFNDYSSVRSTSKLSIAVVLYEMGLPFPRTVYTAPKLIQEMLDAGGLKAPFIYKYKLGSHGQDNFLIKDKAELSKVGKWGMVAQPFVPNKGDYRVLIVGSKHAVIKRTAAPGSHLNNTSQGGSAELIKDFSPAVIKQCRQLADKYNMTIAGVDVIQDEKTGEYLLLEINHQPQLMTGAFVDLKKHLLKDYIKGLD